MTPHDVLGVNRDASEEDIKKAYRKKAMELHPDRNPGDEDAAIKFKEVQAAYDKLTKDEPEGPQLGYDIFDQFFNFGRRPARGDDLLVEHSVSFTDAAKGCTADVPIYKRKTCSSCSGSRAAPNGTRKCKTCNGQGQVTLKQGNMTVRTSCGQCGGRGGQVVDPCEACAGIGEVKETVTINVNFPQGMRHGDRVRISGQGQSGPGGNGDAYVQIKVEPHQLFQRRGDDLTYKMPITYTQAVFGDTIEVLTLSGPKETTVPAGSKTGDVVTIKGLGLKNPQTGRYGDFVVVLEVDIYLPDNHAAKKALKTLSGHLGKSEAITEFRKKIGEVKQSQQT